MMLRRVRGWPKRPGIYAVTQGQSKRDKRNGVSTYWKGEDLAFYRVDGDEAQEIGMGTQDLDRETCKNPANRGWFAFYGPIKLPEGAI